MADASGSLELLVLARYDAASVDSPPRTVVAIEVCRAKSVESEHCGNDMQE